MLSILLNGHTVGSASLQNGTFQAKCPIDNGYIYRLELVGDGRLPLGVMLPQGGDFVLKKSNIPQKDWLHCEALRSLPGEKICPPLPFALSHGESIGDCSFCTDELLKNCLIRTQGIKTAVWDKVRYIYFPFVLSEESPMAPFFFCLSCFEADSVYYAAIKIEDNIPRPV